MSRLIVVVLLLLGVNGFTQEKKWKQLGGAEKFWVFTHPFTAKKAYRLSQQTITELDSLKKIKKLKPLLHFPNTNSGSRFDALRHVYWMSLLSRHIGPKRALWLGKAHEKKNRKDFKKGRLEDKTAIDKVALDMDLFNNRFGASIGRYCKKCDDSKLLNAAIEALRKGELLIIKQNSAGKFLNEEDDLLEDINWVGKWINDRMLVPSNSGL